MSSSHALSLGWLKRCLEPEPLTEDERFEIERVIAAALQQAEYALDIKSINESTKDRRCIEIWLANPVTARNRIALTAALTRPDRGGDNG